MLIATGSMSVEAALISDDLLRASWQALILAIVPTLACVLSGAWEVERAAEWVVVSSFAGLVPFALVIPAAMYREADRRFHVGLGIMGALPLAVISLVLLVLVAIEAAGRISLVLAFAAFALVMFGWWWLRRPPQFGWNASLSGALCLGVGVWCWLLFDELAVTSVTEFGVFGLLVGSTVETWRSEARRLPVAGGRDATN